MNQELKKYTYHQMDWRNYEHRYKWVEFLEDEELSVIRWLIESVRGNTDNLSVLDIGCGTGRILKIFPSNSYVGLDYTPDFIEYARSHYGSDHRVFVLGDKDSLPNFQQKFDILLFIWTFEDIDNPIAEVNKYRHLLNNKALIVFNLFNKASVHGRTFSWIFRKVFKWYPVSYFSTGEIISLLKDYPQFSLKSFKSIWWIGSISIAKLLARMHLWWMVKCMHVLTKLKMGLNTIYLLQYDEDIL